MHEPNETAAPAQPGALEELAGDPSSRKRFLKAVGGAGAAGALASLLAACGSKKTKLTPGGSAAGTGAGVGTDQYGPGDLGIVRYATALEYIEADFYAAAAGSGKLAGRALDMARRFGAHERQHVQALEGAVAKLGGKPPARSTTHFPLTSKAEILKFALALEGLGVAALLAQADRIQSKELLAVALSIHSVEGRHAAALASLQGKDPAPEGPFARGAYPADVLNQLHSLVAV